VRVVMFYHSLVSDWNHGNAHFLRGVATELVCRGHDVCIFEPLDGWSAQNLLREHGELPAVKFRSAYPHLSSVSYELASLNLERTLANADLVIVHEWNDPELVARIGQHRKSRGDYLLFFHDTHHRSVSAPEEMRAYDLSNYDGVLVFGKAIRDVYLQNDWSTNVWTWHESADTRVFYPLFPIEAPKNGTNGNGHSGNSNKPCPDQPYEGDLVWIGNWGDGERANELREFLIEPLKQLGLKARVYGVRYPEAALRALADAGIEYAGWAPNYEVPQIFNRFRITVHVPRGLYVDQLPGIPTIRVFEALACGIPLVCSPWRDSENLFTAGEDYLIARDGTEMKRHLRALLSDGERARSLAEHGRRTIRARHTCVHRVNELLAIYEASLAAVRESVS
jgi:spore maturation protein CgeB